MTQTLPPEIREALDAHTTVTLAYADEGGPQACAVLYAVAEGPGAPSGTSAAGPAALDDVSGRPGPVRAPVLVFVTSAATRHGRALLAGDTRVAFTAQRDGQEWTALTGLQGRGVCRLLRGADRAAAWRAYSARFPYVEGTERLRQAMERAELWELRPDWIRLIDNAKGFGHKSEWVRTDP
ncbi:pyridoxamine 5'-phosphate oxidase [Streptomyces cinnamoneus]|uniref:pyridoxamine 5'-phosphate oxidase n=1 Tax=Streptomyces cinnamoneus TaxID=53446 RepID=UPI003797D507